MYQGFILGKSTILSIKLANILLLVNILFMSFYIQMHPSIGRCDPVLSVATDSSPNLDFSTFLGGTSGLDHGSGIALSFDGSYYVTGQTGSDDFPTENAFNYTFGGDRDVFISKFSSNNTLLWSTFLGGNDIEHSDDIAIGADGSCYIVGSTRSNDFPIRNAYSDTCSGSDDLFITKFSANGSLLWSTYLGGNDRDFGYSITVASDGSCYVSGETWSTDFPTKNAYDTTYNGWYTDSFVAKFSSTGTLLWSTFLGGEGNENAYGIAVASDGNCYVAGLTRSTNFPVENAYDDTQNGDWDVFITKFSSEGNLLWSTFFGGALWDEAQDIAVASDGSCYLTGYTVSEDFPTKYAHEPTYTSWGDAFAAKFSSHGSLLWSTFLGGDGGDRSYGIAVTADGSCYLTGETSSTDFPTLNPIFDSLKGTAFDTFAAKYSSFGDLLWSTYLGGSQTDKAYSISLFGVDCCFIVGTTHSSDFPTNNAYDSTLGSTSDAFIAKFTNIPVPTIRINIENTILFLTAGLLLVAFITDLTIIILRKRRKGRKGTRKKDSMRKESRNLRNPSASRKS